MLYDRFVGLLHGVKHRQIGRPGAQAFEVLPLCMYTLGCFIYLPVTGQSGNITSEIRVGMVVASAQSPRAVKWSSLMTERVGVCDKYITTRCLGKT